MKNIIILAVLATFCGLLNVVQAQIRQQCYGNHEVYLLCGPSCPPTCDSPSPKVDNCPAHCIAGCFCEPKYLRNDKGKCVKPKNCEKLTFKSVFKKLG
ncbi:chymotrypsin inhibitor-like [Culex quinquefasciatus]|uniref:chymotrypsin inhibitor-like n=1 Tax=Culex quinquefasciatus TaxID=7176 RepID=UPI0018E33A1B|nr:chymotrypsin inhibitor-like [Culex quinquefasciatus]